MGNLLGCIVVGESTVAIKERFGRFEGVLQPGCYCLPWFFGFQIAGFLTLRAQQLDVYCETKTKDNVFVTIIASIQYRALADKANHAFYKLGNTKSYIEASLSNVIRSSVANLDLDNVFEHKKDIAKTVEEKLDKVISAYGYEIIQTLIVDIQPDEHVKQAMNEMKAASLMRMSANEKAEAEKIIQVKKAEGENEAKYLSGLGIARQHQAIVDGFQNDIMDLSAIANVGNNNANLKDVMNMVLMTQYFDTMREVGATSKSTAVFLHQSPTVQNGDHS